MNVQITITQMHIIGLFEIIFDNKLDVMVRTYLVVSKVTFNSTKIA